MVSGLQPALGPLRRLRRGRADPRRHHRRAALRRPAPAPTRRSGAAVRAAASPAASTPAGAPAAHCTSGCASCSATTPERSRRDCRPSTQTLAATERPSTVISGWTAAPPQRSCADLADRSTTLTHADSRRPARRQGGRASAQHPGRHRRAATHATSKWSGSNAGSPAPSPTGHDPDEQAPAAPLRGLAPAAAAAPAQPRRRRHHAQPGRRRPAARPRRHQPARLARRPPPDPGHRRQPDLDAWLTSDDAVHRREAGHFVRWAKQQKLTRLDFAATSGAARPRPSTPRRAGTQARRLLHDDTLKPDDRVAGLLVLLYAQWPAAISRLTIDHVDVRRARSTAPARTRARRAARAPRRPRPRTSSPPDAATPPSATAAASRWLFPGGQPGRPISSYQLGERLRQLGLRPGPVPLHRTVPARHRTPRRPPRPHPRHPHHGRRRLATSLRRGLDQLRRRGQPPDEAMRQAFRQFQYPTSPEHADLTLKRAALDRTRQPETPAGDYQPDDPLITWLQSL